MHTPHIGSDYRQDKLQTILDTLVQSAPLQHAFLAVETADGLHWQASAGAINNAKPDPNLPFFIASIDKLMTATVIMQLFEKNLIDLNAKLNRYLPVSSIQGLHVLNATDYSDQLTVRHLLSHSSGLADWLEDSPKNAPSLIEQLLQAGDQTLDSTQILARVRDQLTPHFAPADLSDNNHKAIPIRYSDTNYVLLKLIIEAVTHQPISQVYATHLFKPLKLQNTFFAETHSTANCAPLLAAGQPIHVPRIIASIHGIYSTTTDLIRFMRALVNNQLFENSQTFSEMQTWHRFGFPLDKAALRAPNWPIEYGLGLKRFKLPRWLQPFQPTPAVIGHTGSTGCWLFYCEQWDIFIAGSVNEISAGAVPFRWIGKILRAARSE